MAGNRTGEGTKERILLAAQQVFLDKGFDKAKMEEIAKRAGVTKAMLYYHFNTKQNILNEIVKKVLDGVKKELRSNMARMERGNPEHFRALLQAMIAYYKQRQNIFQLILSEYIGNRSPGSETLGAFNDVFGVLMELSGRYANKQEEEFLIRVFFFNAMPMMLYSCLSERFCSDFNIAPEKCLEVFTDAFADVFAGAVSASKE